MVRKHTISLAAANGQKSSQPELNRDDDDVDDNEDVCHQERRFYTCGNIMMTRLRFAYLLLLPPVNWFLALDGWPNKEDRILPNLSRCRH